MNPFNSIKMMAGAVSGSLLRPLGVALAADHHNAMPTVLYPAVTKHKPRPAGAKLARKAAAGRIGVAQIR